MLPMDNQMEDVIVLRTHFYVYMVLVVVVAAVMVVVCLSIDKKVWPSSINIY